MPYWDSKYFNTTATCCPFNPFRSLPHRTAVFLSASMLCQIILSLKEVVVCGVFFFFFFTFLQVFNSEVVQNLKKNKIILSLYTSF